MRKIIILSFKKTVIITCLIVILIGGVIFINNYVLKNSIHTNLNKVFKPHKTYFEPDKPPEGTEEEIYHDIFMSLLHPYISKSINEYYGQPFTHDPWSNKILSIERPNGYRTFYFIIKLEVTPLLRHAV